MLQRMEQLRRYLRGLYPPEQADFAVRAGTTIAYLRKRISDKGRIGPQIAIGLDRESGGVIDCREICPELDWAYLEQKARDSRSEL